MANPRGNLAGFTDPSVPGWQRIALERVKARQKKTKRHTERSSGTLVTYDDPLRPLLDEACRRRNMSMQGYARRALGAFIARDLGLPLSEVLSNMPTPTPYRAGGGSGRKDRTHDDGRGMGPWLITGLEEV